MQLAKANAHKGADLPNRFRMRKSLAGGEIGGGCGSPTGKVGCEHNAIVSPNRKNGFAQQPGPYEFSIQQCGVGSVTLATSVKAIC